MAGNHGVVALLYVRNVPDQLHRRMKAAAALLGESLNTAVVRAVEAEVERMEQRLEEQRQGRAADERKRRGK